MPRSSEFLAGCPLEPVMKVTEEQKREIGRSVVETHLSN
jgi:hypothetical protein